MIHPVVPTSAALPDSISNHHNNNNNNSNGYSSSSGERSPQDSPLDELPNSNSNGTSPSVDRKLLLRNQTIRPSNNSSSDSRENIGNNNGGGGGGGGESRSKLHPPTIDRCPTLRELKQVCMDTVFPSSPEKIYNLMYTSGFMKEFWSNTQKLLG